MNLSDKTIEKLRMIINGDNTAGYRRGLDLVVFFNKLGFKDTYGQGFPSRWVYTEDKLKQINGTSKMKDCIQTAFAVVDYIERIDELDNQINDFNRYLAFDKWRVERKNELIKIERLDKVIVQSTSSKNETDEEAFLKRTFAIEMDSLGLDPVITEILKNRLSEIEDCVNNNASLSAVIMIGSVMEGVLLGSAMKHPREFNQVHATPIDNDTGKPKKFQDWTLNNYIDAAAEVGILKQDVKKFSHVLRDFRNYIHPYSQMATQFTPDKHTAMICFQVLKAAINQISDYEKNQKI